MQHSNRFQGTVQQLYVHWPAYTLLYGGMVLALVGIGISIEQRWWGFIPLLLLLFLFCAYFLVANLWSAHQLFDSDGLTPHHVLFDMGQIEATDTFVFIDLGTRRQAVALARRLTTGQEIVVDVYSPQWVSGRAYARYRRRMLHPPNDPRLSWRNGSIDLLPLPDKSVPMVIMCQVASALLQEGDQLRLLHEIYRILTPNGRLLIAERVRTQTNWLLMGPRALSLKRPQQWRDLLRRAGYRVRKERDLRGVIHCFRVDKPTQSEAQQLPLGFDL